MNQAGQGTHIKASFLRPSNDAAQSLGFVWINAPPFQEHHVYPVETDAVSVGFKTNGGG